MDLPFEVECRSLPAEGGVWLIQARLIFRDGHLNADRELLARGREALVRAIGEAVLEGRAHGATSVRIFMDAGNGRITEVGSEGLRDHFPLQ